MRSRQSQESGEQMGTGEDSRSSILLTGRKTVATARPANTRTLTTACTVQLLCV